MRDFPSREGWNIRAEFDVAHYFGRRYQAEDARSVLSSIVGWLASPIISCRFHDFPPVEANFSRMSDTSGFPRSPTLLSIDSPQFEDILDDVCLQAVEGVLAPSGRPLRFSPWVAPDDTAVYEVYVGLDSDFRFQTMQELVGATCGESQLMQSLTEANPLLGTLGVDPETPSLSDLRGGGRVLPPCGYLANAVVEKLGRSVLAAIFDGCPKTEFLSTGGLFYCWTWLSIETLGSSAYREHKYRLNLHLDEIISAMMGAREATQTG